MSFLSLSFLLLSSSFLLFSSWFLYILFFYFLYSPLLPFPFLTVNFLSSILSILLSHPTLLPLPILLCFHIFISLFFSFLRAAALFFFSCPSSSPYLFSPFSPCPFIYPPPLNCSPPPSLNLSSSFLHTNPFDPPYFLLIPPLLSLW